jgi:hypothetical protein
MRNFLNQLTRVDGNPLNRLRERLNAIQGAIYALANGENITLTGGLKMTKGDGKVSIQAAPGVPAKGGGAAATTPPLYLVSSRPSYVPAGTPVAEGYLGTWLTWGFCNGRLPTNWTTRIDSLASGTYTKWFKLKVNILPAADRLEVTSCAWEAWDAEDEKEDDPWAENGNRPAFIYLTLGTLYVADGVPTLSNNGAGSLQLIEHLTSITQNGHAGFHYKKSINSIRLAYGP